MLIMDKRLKQLQQFLNEFEDKTELDLFFLYGHDDPILKSVDRESISSLTQLMRGINDLYRDDVLMMEYPLAMTLEYDLENPSHNNEVEVSFYLKEVLRDDLRKLLMR